MPKAEYRSALRSRKLINNALAELIKEKPLDKITVTDVVKRADLNRGTFYAHYTDIQDVVNRQVDEACNALQDALRTRQADTPGQPNPEDVLRQLQAFLESDLTFYRSMMNSSVAGVALERIRGVFITYMTEHEKDFGVHDHGRYLFDIMFASGGVVAMYQDWFAGRLPLTLDELTDRAIEVTIGITQNDLQ